jgi:hypothetical protein
MRPPEKRGKESGVAARLSKGWSKTWKEGRG